MNPKLTDGHIYIDKMKKMKVSHAAQIFSQPVGSIMKILAVSIFFLNLIYVCSSDS